MLVFIVHNLTKANLALASLARAKGQTSDSLHAQLMNMILFLSPFEDCPLKFQAWEKIFCEPAFLYSKGARTSPITHAVFTPKLRRFLCSAGLKPTQYSGHCFCRGGATYAFRCGAPVELISLQGEWSSHAVLLYIAQPLERRISVAHLIA